MRLALLVVLALAVPCGASAVGAAQRPPGAEDPSWLGDDRLLYADGTAQDLYVRTLGGDVRQLTHLRPLPTWERLRRWPVLSADRTHVAFDGDDGLTVLALATGAPTVVARSYERGPSSFSPDGTRLAYPTKQGLDVVASAGGTPRLVASGGRAPEWSPDGALIVFDAGDAISVVRPDGTGVQSLAQGSGARWSPEGALIAYEARDAVWVVDRTGRAPRRLGAGSEPRWWPDGRTIVYRGPAGDVRLVAADGGLPQVVVESRQAERTPVPSPGGAHVAYVVDNEHAQTQPISHGNVSDLYVANGDGSGRRELTGACGIDPETDPRVVCLDLGVRAVPADIAGRVAIRVTRIIAGSASDRVRSARIRGYLADPSGNRVVEASVQVDGPTIESYPASEYNDGFFSAQLAPKNRRPLSRRLSVPLTAVGAHGVVARRVVSFPAALIR